MVITLWGSALDGKVKAKALPKPEGGVTPRTAPSIPVLFV
jgi:hypothetical protein